MRPMPELISVSEFLGETWDDYNSPTTSGFVPKMGHCRNTAGAMEEALDTDRSALTKMKKSMKALYNSGIMHTANEEYLAENLERLGTNAHIRDQEQDIGTAFKKFSVVTRDLSALMRSMMQSLNNIVLFPLDSFLKSDLKGVKGDLKKPFDKSYKEYDAKFAKIEKEKKQLAKEVGMVRTDVTGAEIADEMEKERRMFQLQMCEYLIKVNEIKTKKGADLLEHLVEYYRAQTNFFQDGIKTLDHYNSYIEDLVTHLQKIKQRQDQERRKLLELREELKSSMSTFKEPLTPCSSTGSYSLHQLQGNKSHGCEKSGYLLKKSEGRIKKVWQRRKCRIKDGFMSLSHSDESKDPVTLNLLTCQVKFLTDDPGKKCFDLISSYNSRTYHLQADDEKDMEEWISVLNNAKDEVLMKAFQDNANSPSINKIVRELTSSILDRVRRLPGNKYCCDCGAPDPEWLSTNLGVLICLACCGIHRQLGVHISRTQSLIIDDLGTSQLLLARVVGNAGFNEIMEATLDMKLKPNSTSPMDDRRDFICAKYEEHKYAYITCTDKEDLKEDLQQAIMSRDIFALLQVAAEGIDLMTTLPNTANEETALHLAIRLEDGTSLHIVDFIIQNCNINKLGKFTRDGNTALHLCALLNRTECMKLVLRTKPDIAPVENRAGQTALDIAKENGHTFCVELLKAALSGKKDAFSNVNIEWDLIPDDHLYDHVDYSDDELDSTPERKTRSRPTSLVSSAQDTASLIPNSLLPPKDRAMDGEALKPPLTTSSSLVISAPSSNKPKIPGLNPYNNSSSLQSLLGPSSSSPSPSPSVSTSSSSISYFHYQHSNIVDGFRAPIQPPPPIPPKKKSVGLTPPPGGGGGGGTHQFLHNQDSNGSQSSQHSFHGKPGHSRNKSEPPKPPHEKHTRTPSEPPPRPTRPQTAIHLPGAKFVLPPPPDIDKLPSSTNRGNSGPPRNGRTQSALDKDIQQVKETKDPLEYGDTWDGSPPPIPQPRAKKKMRRRCKALYDCDADNPDELSFKEGDVITILSQEEDDWWEGEIENEPEKKGLFPVSFMHIMTDVD